MHTVVLLPGANGLDESVTKMRECVAVQRGPSRTLQA